MDLFNDAMKYADKSRGKVENSTKYNNDQSLTFTPVWVVNEMLDMLPDQVWNEHTTFLDISCKTGVFLVEIFKRLDKTLKDIPEFEDDKVRREYILNKQLYGLTLDDNLSLMMSRRNLTGNAFSGNIKYIGYSNKSYIDIIKSRNEKILKDLVKEEFGQMNFDVVVGNPPYNNDMYLDFARGGQLLQSKYELLITPAKWQAKGGQKNEDFRRNIVPYMSKIVYYPDATELFNIAEVDGVCLYLLNKTNTFDKKDIINRSFKNRIFESTLERNICGQLNNAAYKILNTIYSLSQTKHVKVETSASHFGFKSGESTWLYSGDIQIFSNGKEIGCCSRQDVRKNVQDIEKWKVMVNQMVGYSFFYDEKGMSFGGNKLYILKPNQICGYNYFCIKVCDSYEEAISTKSYYDTKLVRFIMLTSLTTSSIGNDEAFRFVPDPGAFDHIFTDQELYKKYNLTDEEINIIESVIKERK